MRRRFVLTRRYLDGIGQLINISPQLIQMIFKKNFLKNKKETISFTFVDVDTGRGRLRRRRRGERNGQKVKFNSNMILSSRFKEINQSSVKER